MHGINGAFEYDMLSSIIALYNRVILVCSARVLSNMSLHRVFVYGTLKRGEPNHHWMTDTSKGFSRLLGVGRTVKKYPLVIATKYNIPFILDCPGRGHNVIGEVYEVDESMLQHLDILEEHPTFYTRELEQIELCTDDAGLQSWIYLLKKFKPEMLEMEHFADYSSSGAHGLVYAERYQRDPSYNCKQDVVP